MSKLNNTLRIKITQESMRSGDYYSNTEYPLALALKKRFPSVDLIRAGGNYASVGGWNNYDISDTSAEMLANTVGKPTAKALTVTLTKAN